jgi:ribosomal protein S12 methylthiotransferase accessory factor
MMPGQQAPLLAFLDEVGVPAGEAQQRLASSSVAVVGLEGHGAHAAAALAALGVGTLLLVDPYPCQPGNLALMPALGPDAVGQPRELVLKSAIEARGAAVRVTPGGTPAVTRASIDALARGCDLLIGCFDEGFSSTDHWLNAASLTHRVPALYARLHGPVALVGPLVVPGQTACYLCWRIRSIACQGGFTDAMARERRLDRQRRPALHDRAVPPPLAAQAGAVIAQEALKHLLAVDGRTPAGSVQEIDALHARTETHTVLRVPDCPRCAGGSEPRPTPPPLADLARATQPTGDIIQAIPALVSRRCGVVTALERAPLDPGEPTVPHAFGAELANHLRLDEAGSRYGMCAGKGMTPNDARRSALGEAVERYSAGWWRESDVVRATRGELDGASLDPRELVLYRPEQYAQLRYAPYADDTTMGWTRTRSLVTGSEVLTPAIAVFISYLAPTPDEVVCPVSSNGLAAGASLADAVLTAAYEVLERDAFLITWMNRLPAERIDPRTHPDPDVVGLYAAYRQHGVELELYRLPTDHPCHVFLALGVQQRYDGPAMAVGLAADLDACTAARRAALEMGQLRPGLRAAMRAPEARSRIERLVADPQQVVTPDDHALLYADRRRSDAFDFLRRSPLVAFEWTRTGPSDTGAGLRKVVEHFRSQGSDVLYCDLTPPDMAPLGLRTARVLVPGFQPIHFGWKEPRLGGRRLYELPRRLGVTPVSTTPEQLNPDPHPLA